MQGSILGGSGLAACSLRTAYAAGEPQGDRGRSESPRRKHGLLVTNQVEGWSSAGNRTTSSSTVGKVWGGWEPLKEGSVCCSSQRRKLGLAAAKTTWFVLPSPLARFFSLHQILEQI